MKNVNLESFNGKVGYLYNIIFFVEASLKVEKRKPSYHTVLAPAENEIRTSSHVPDYKYLDMITIKIYSDISGNRYI